MTAFQINRKTYLWIFLLLLVVCCNLLVYRLPITSFVLAEEAKWVVLGSLFDFAIVIPLLLLALTRKKPFSIKRFIMFMAGGLIFARFLIPTHYFGSFVGITYAGVIIEAALLLFELALLFMLARHLPSIFKQVKLSEHTALFSFLNIAEKRIRKHPLIHIVVSELLMVYYAFFTWLYQLEKSISLCTKSRV